MMPVVAAFDPDIFDSPVTVLQHARATVADELPLHKHRKGQLVLVLHGAATCEVEDGVWMVPSECAVWIPPGMRHSNKFTTNAHICFVFIDNAQTVLPDYCCTLGSTGLIREIVQTLAERPKTYATDDATGRLAAVLLDELGRLPRDGVYLPVYGDARLQKILTMLKDNPADRSTIAEWAQRVAMSERSLERLTFLATGLTFGRWRQQFQIVLALQYLADELPVNIVAERLGYESVPAFVTMFKKALGKSPTQYMKERQAGTVRIVPGAHGKTLSAV
jgi:AraC-like DNA-binding protein